MKKLKMLALAAVAVLSMMLASCGNYMMFDTEYTFDYAIVSFPDGSSRKIDIQSWTDYEGEQIQIVDTEGNVYLINSVNCVLVKEKD